MNFESRVVQDGAWIPSTIQKRMCLSNCVRQVIERQNVYGLVTYIWSWRRGYANNATALFTDRLQLLAHRTQRLCQQPIPTLPIPSTLLCILLNLPNEPTGDGILCRYPTVLSPTSNLAESRLLPKCPRAIRVFRLLVDIHGRMLPWKVPCLQLYIEDQMMKFRVHILAMHVQQLARGPPNIPVHEFGQKEEY